MPIAEVIVEREIEFEYKGIKVYNVYKANYAENGKRTYSFTFHEEPEYDIEVIDVRDLDFAGDIRKILENYIDNNYDILYALQNSKN